MKRLLLSVSLVFAGYVLGRDLISERAGRLAAVFCAFWYELIYFAPRPLSDIVSTYFLIGALAFLVQPGGRRQPLLFGFTAALSLATRIQFGPVIAFLGLVAVFRWDRRSLLRGAVGFACVVLFAGAIDRLTWGGWFVSYYNNIRINVVQGVSLLFGTKEPSWYLNQLLSASGVLWVLALPMSLVFLKKLWIPIVCLVIVVGAHSALPHKEYRFIFPAVPLLLLITAATVTALVEGGFTGCRKHKLLTGGAVLLFGCASLAGSFKLLPDEDFVYPGPSFWVRDDRLRVFETLRQDRDLAAVFVTTYPWYRSGGYYYLHRDVPVYFRSIHFQTTAQASDYVSHILCGATTESAEGFETIGRIGAIEIRKRAVLPRRYPRLPSYSRHVFQRGIDAGN